MICTSINQRLHTPVLHTVASTPFRLSGIRESKHIPIPPPESHRRILSLCGASEFQFKYHLKSTHISTEYCSVHLYIPAPKYMLICSQLIAVTICSPRIILAHKPRKKVHTYIHTAYRFPHPAGRKPTCLRKLLSSPCCGEREGVVEKRGPKKERNGRYVFPNLCRRTPQAGSADCVRRAVFEDHGGEQDPGV